MDEIEEMDDGEMWREHKKMRQEKRWSNVESSLDILRRKGIEYETLNSSVSHYRIGDWNFWPTTGKFLNQKTGESGRGVFNLIKKVEKLT